MDRNYSLKDLQALDSLLRERHVGQAAAVQSVSQPAMSMTLKRLREIFNDPLLIRSGNAHRLTDLAEDLQCRVPTLIKEMENLAEIGHKFQPSKSQRTFTLILTDYIDAILVPVLHKRVREIAPGIELRIIGPDPFRLARVFNDGNVDLTVSYFPGAPGDLITRNVFSDRMVCVVREGHPALEKIMDIQTFCNLDHVAIEPAQASMYRSVLDEALARQRLSLRVAISKPDFLGVPFLLEQSDFISTMPEKLAALFTHRFKLVTFHPPIELPKLEIQMMWHRSTHRSPAHMWLREQVLEICREISQT